MDVKQWLGEDNTLGLSIWENKYRYENETFDEWLDRVSNDDEELRQLIIEKKFLFGGRILAGRNTDTKSCMSNCFVLPEPQDNIESIFDTAKESARTFSYGGGVGFALSKLRPKGMVVHNSAKTTTGSVSFMDLYSMVTQIIGQNNRKGALMLSMDIGHPDIEDFINVKTDLDRVTKANISVMSNDRFMEAVIYDDDWVMSFTTEHGDNYTKTVKARYLFNLIATNNHRMGEPGFLYMDRIYNWNLTCGYDDYKIVGTNPCLVGDTLIQTIEGAKPIKDLVGTQPFVYCMDENGKLIIKQASKVWKTRENAQLVEIDFNRGKLICTPDHLIYTRNRGWVKAIELQPKDRLNGLGFSKGNEIDERIKLTSDKKYYRHHRFIMEQMGYDVKGKDIHHKDGNHLNNIFSNLEILSHSEHSKHTNIGHEPSCPQSIIDGRFISKEEHKPRKKTDKVNYENKGKNFIVKSVKVLDYVEDVYDMTVDDVHNFVANNIIVHNCGEQPLSDYSSCLLGSINLSEFVVNPFTKNAYFNFEDFKNAIRIVVKAMDDVLEENIERLPLKKQKEKAEQWRQVGIGQMGLADMFIKLGLKYGEQKSLEISEVIAKILINEAMRNTALLAKERGTFPKFDYNSLIKSDFYNKNIDEDVKKKVEMYGMRNCALLSIAPTGTIGTFLETSTGIEPNFKFKYTRKTESLGNQEEYHDVYAKIAREYREKNNNKELPSYFVESDEIEPLNRIKMQSIWQTYIDTAISSTVNLPENATVEDIEEIYINAWKYGLKGITVFRNNCERMGILTTDKKEDEEVEEVKELGRGEWKSLAEDTYYVKRKLTIGCGTLKLFIGYSPNEKTIQDLYIVKSGQGGCEKNLQAIAISMSALLRVGGNIEQLEKAFSGIAPCPSFVSSRAKGIQLSKGNYCGMAIINEVKAFLEELNGKEQLKVENKKEKPQKSEEVEGKECPECHKKTLMMQGGCDICTECGYSHCG